MQIEEAASLSIQASIMNEGEVHILDMGEPIKLLNVIERMKDILNGNSEIKIVGLRKDEKLFEELWSTTESIKPTSHPASKVILLDRRYEALPILAEFIDSDVAALETINMLIPQI
jgi:FlaA1/EpsC-like NDP-sugar epimerase